MSDAQRLLFQIQSMLGAAVLTVGSQACDAPSGSHGADASLRSQKANRTWEEGAASKTLHARQGSVSAKTPDGKAVAMAKPKSVAVKNTLPPPPIPGYRLGDPPLVEGWDPEEATCVSGNWCGPAAAAMKVVRVGMEHDLDPKTKCPTHLMGKKEGGVDKKQKVYRGMSADRMMRGTLQHWRTQREREQGGAADLCCYHWFDYCAGRPLDQGERTQQGRQAIAAARDGERCDAQAMELARAYWADADDEYDSVAAFARCSLELFALGAPAELIEASQRASLDELKHARQCQALSRHYLAHDWASRDPAKLEVTQVELADFLLSTFRYGCVGEAVASLRGSRMAAKSKEPKVQALLEEIAQDEAQHAALAWQILDWGLSVGGDELRAMLAQHAERLEQELLAEANPVLEQRQSYAERLSPQELRDCARDTWLGVVQPMLGARLADAAKAQVSPWRKPRLL